MSVLAVVRRNPFVLPMAVVAALAIFFISEGSYWQSLDTIKSLRGIAVARLQIERLERSLADAETGQRGYLLTGRSEYLQPYQKAHRDIAQVLDVLDQHFKAQPVESVLVRQLRALSERKLSELDETVRLARDGKRGTAIELVLSGIGKQDMESIRELTNQLMAQQTGERDTTNRSLDKTLLLSRYGVAALSAVLLLALVLYLRKSDALTTQQQAQKRLMQAAHDRLEAEVAQRTAQLTDLTRHLQTAREDERHRLARDLHDELGALLTAAKLDAARIKSRLADSAPEAQARLVDLVDKLNSGIALGRRIIEDLRPSTLGHLGLVAALDILAREFAERSGVQVHRDLAPVQLGPKAELVVYRVVQEAITNLSKYAKAQNVWVVLTGNQPGWGGGGEAEPGVEVSVRDDGVGFNAQAPARSAYGLLGMRFRVEAEGGILRVQSSVGHGTHLRVWLPATPSTPAPAPALQGSAAAAQPA
jgi:signal transduction histidine kinase